MSRALAHELVQALADDDLVGLKAVGLATPDYGSLADVTLHLAAITTAAVRAVASDHGTSVDEVLAALADADPRL